MFRIRHQGRIFRFDPVVGWKLRPRLNILRTGKRGETWRIRTDESGIRGSSAWDPRASLRILILGDSFALGDGVSEEQRFDTHLRAEQPEWSTINLGVSGYGTDQAVLSSRPYVAELRPGDIVLVLTGANDFSDILNRQHSGRSKPWFERQGDTLVEHPPAWTWAQALRDRSYLLAWILQRWPVGGRPRPADPRAGPALYRAMLEREIGSWAARGLRTVVAHHGISSTSDTETGEARRAAIEGLGRLPGTTCLCLDDALSTQPWSNLFLPDGHWTGKGHRAVAEAVRAHVLSLQPPPHETSP